MRKNIIEKTYQGLKTCLEPPFPVLFHHPCPLHLRHCHCHHHYHHCWVLWWWCGDRSTWRVVIKAQMMIYIVWAFYGLAEGKNNKPIKNKRLVKKKVRKTEKKNIPPACYVIIVIIVVVVGCYTINNLLVQ